MPKAKIISVINYKGGVGKTTTTYHIGCSLAQHYHKKVLLVDIDPQNNLTFLCAKDQKWEAFKKERGTIATLYRQYAAQSAVNTRRVIWESPIELDKGKRISNLDLIPCDVELLGDELGLDGTSAPFPNHQPTAWTMSAYLQQRRFLLNALRQVENDYDYILIDCPPNLYLMTQNALFASDAYLVTTVPDYLSTFGFSILYKRIKDFRSRSDAAQTFLGKSYGLTAIADLGGVIFVKVKAVASQEEKMNTFRDRFPGICFPIHTSELTGYSEAAEQNRPVWECRTPNAQNAARTQQYQNITRIFLERFHFHAQFAKANNA
ncbi:MAG TPA: AAA family ATPase [Blastocatellia bacterium]|nr:AAA family ATPase [Blastocatellia bacterium]HMV84959.1 AAA family ATPase [Blastocatellia bacterium]HMY70655.1 AAA family ATPase [Blastocatellia bacterium]HMZ16871.1 AAA family ATPase [Blastocatellia bacterium]HNG32136.1 AAA family ATPase [Blastocatellia bacterium]